MITTHFQPIIQSLFPKEVSVIASPEIQLPDLLLDSERKQIQNAVKKRQDEFAAGRYCAKMALGSLGLDANSIEILNGAEGRPIWPEGFIGSISHARGCYGAVAGKKNQFASLGLDVEEAHRMREKLWEAAMTAEEISFLNKINGDQATVYATTIFSAKEAFFKLQHYVTGEWLGLKDARVELNLQTGKFQIFILKDLAPFGLNKQTFEGKFAFFDGFVATGICLKAI